jgi:protein-disulfide isomerase
MASRKDQKAQAREQRLAKEREAAESAQRKQRLQIIGGIAAIAVVVVVVIIVISGSSSSPKPSADPNSAANKSAQAHAASLLNGVQQTPGKSVMLGDPKAKVTITEYGDLECPACDALETPKGWENSSLQAYGTPGSGTLDALIDKYVKTGKAKLVFKSLETATGGEDAKTPYMWTPQEAAANAAALQGKGWNFVELFYLEQGAEGTKWVDDSFIEGIAKQINGLNYAQWMKDWKSNKETSTQVTADNTAGTQLDSPTGEVATPTLYVTGPKSSKLFVGNATVENVSAAIDASN